MKSFKLVPIGAAFAWFVAASAPAFAVTVTPAGPISLSGATALTKSGNAIGCQARLVGTISGTGEVSISSAVFTGANLCSLVTATNLPWTGHVTNASNLTLNNVGVDVAIPVIGGQCESTAINATIAQNTKQKETTIGLSNQPLSGGCSVSGTLTTTPVINVDG